MKKLFFFILANLLFHLAIAQTWTQKSSIPGVGGNSRMASTSFSNLNTLGFVLGGFRGNTVKSDFWQYNSINDDWLQKDDFPGGQVYAHVSFVIDSIAYVGLGSDQFGTLSTQFWAYNMNSDEWNTIANFPGDGRVYPSSMTINSKGYVGCGVKFVGGNAVYLNDFWEYDPVLNTWTEKANFSGGVRAGTIAFGEAGKGYMGYGESSGFFHWDLYEYSPTGDSWEILADFPSTSISFSSVVTLANKAYIIGGEFQDHVYTDNVWEYDANNNSWQPITSFPGTTRRNAISFVLNNDIYYGTGQIGALETNVTGDFWVLEGLATTVTDELFNDGINIYPNPFHNNLKIESSNKIKRLEIYNSQGTIVYSEFNPTKNEIDLSFLSSGIYFLKVETNAGLITNKKLVHE